MPPVPDTLIVPATLVTNAIKDTIIKDTIVKQTVIKETIIKDTIVKVQPAKPKVTVVVKKVFPSVTTIYLSQLGVREASGKNDGRQVEKYLRAVGLGKGYPWCAAFVRWCFDSAGIKTTINGAAASVHNTKRLVYAKHKVMKEPQPGDAFTLWYNQLNRIGHTGFYHRKINASIYESCEGNTNEAGSREGDGVYKKYRSLNATYSINRWQSSSVND